eukprot:3885426-Prorocentrum_lima.AAC.1
MVPKTRLKLAVPFIGKDVPSRASEFAHPDVIISLTVMAFRYQGLRKTDFTHVMDAVAEDYSKEPGPPTKRRTTHMYNDWVHSSDGFVRGIDPNPFRAQNSGEVGADDIGLSVEEYDERE